MTAFSSIVAAFKSRLESSPPVSENVFRAQTRSISEDMATAVNVFLEGAMPEQGAIAGAPVDWQSRIAVELYARSSTSTGDVAVDSLLQATYARLAADTTLSGAVDDIGEPAIETEYDAHGQTTGWMRLTYTVLHRTENGSIA